MTVSVKSLTVMAFINVLSCRQYEILEGLMLGDGCIPKFSASHNPHISVTRSIKDIEYSQWLVNELDGFITNRGIAEYSTVDVRTHNIYKSCSFRTICSPIR
jgi:hypothetical protein